jgi:hypothetical protein
MQIRSLLLSLLAAGVVGMGALPKPASALMLGDVKLHSWLGEPLRATIPIRAGDDEQLDSRCFYLARPEQQDGADAYLTQGTLVLEESAAGLKLRLSTSKPVNSPFLNVIIEARCGQGTQKREFVLLLDPLEQPAPAARSRLAHHSDLTADSSLRQGEAYAIQAGESINDIVERLYPNDAQQQRRMARGIKKTNPELASYSRKRALPEGHSIRIPDLKALPPVVEKPAPAQPAPGKPEAPARLVVKSESQVSRPESATFRLQLSSGILDMSAVGSMSEEQRQFLREKQLLLESDDQVAAMMSIKNRISQLEATIEEMKLALERASPGAPEVVQSIPIPETINSAPVAGSVPESVFQMNVKDLDWRQVVGNDSFRSMAGALLILLLLLSSWWRWRQSRAEAKLNTLFGQQFEAEPVVPAATMQFEAPIKSARETPEPQIGDFAIKAHAAGEEMDYPTTIFGSTDDMVSVTETESVLDEADLYLAYGWGKRAIDLLSSHLDRHPDDVPLLKKMFEAYHALGMKDEFEHLAIQSRSIDDNGLRVLIQKLGRILEAENPLYQSSLDAENTFAEDMNPNTIAMDDEADIEVDINEVLESEISEALKFELDSEPAQPTDSEVNTDEDHLNWPELQQKTIEGRRFDSKQ